VTYLQGKNCIGFLVAIVQITAVLVLWMQKRCDLSDGNPEPWVKIEVHTNVHVCAKN
jgi:hypothetical protein